MVWQQQLLKFRNKDIPSIIYHSHFDYLLTEADLAKWVVGNKFPKQKYKLPTNFKSPSLKKRVQREELSRSKLEIAKKAANFLRLIPTFKFVGITGSLAMFNAGHDSDIDLMLITKRNTLWITRGITLILLKLFGFNLRKAGEEEEKDKLCLNLWLDEQDVKWKQRNEFTAHEIAQVIPLVNKNKTYEKFLFANKWIFDYWPKAVQIEKIKNAQTKQNDAGFLEKLSFKLQYWYMQKKITNEVITPTRAQFHPKKLVT